MDRYWLLTWTTYGTWLPGDPRGFVGRVREEGSPVRVEHDQPGTPCDADLPGLLRASRERMRGDPIWLTAAMADILLEQFHQTATFRNWGLQAVAIMPNHVHLVVGVMDDPDPAQLLRDFKSYGSRALNRQLGQPPSGTWWTQSGSRRKLPHEAAVLAAVEYVRHQRNPLRIWTAAETASGPEG